MEDCTPDILLCLCAAHTGLSRSGSLPGAGRRAHTQPGEALPWLPPLPSDTPARGPFPVPPIHHVSGHVTVLITGTWGIFRCATGPQNSRAAVSHTLQAGSLGGPRGRTRAVGEPGLVSSAVKRGDDTLVGLREFTSGGTCEMQSPEYRSLWLPLWCPPLILPTNSSGRRVEC